eukprot:gnl/MRDRNA2_/MRDRNA2_136285_c0_seq1.p1 gnl/MRDRNA2_/MRDRNA2_136285_c0~~gnl/MRDRNA2_/MRDRNA2_136285_c0_seq1.p1  ORF type:complete len:383 (+),score=63.51 gnl/MRDRNA2_/MRDRNA2_136285_c0_seq1:79-1227(+)
MELQLKAIVGVAAVGFILALVGRVRPELFLKLPSGYVLWALTGNGIPPYLSEDAWTGDTSWLRDDDVVVAVGLKSGSTEMLYCMHQIRVKGDDQKFPFLDPSLTTPWPDLMQFPGGTWEDHRERMNTTILPDESKLVDHWNHPQYPFRIFKSHMLPRNGSSRDFMHVLPVRERPGVKYVAMSRAGLDIVASFATGGSTDTFRQLWGGFPPKINDKEKILEHWLISLLPGGVMSQFYFGYVNAWWAHRHDPNVLLLHYADLKKDRRGTIVKVAEFVGVELSSAQLDIIEHKCSYGYMKKDPRQFGYRLPFNEEFEMAFTTMKKANAMLHGHRGKIGKGRATFEQLQNSTQYAVDYKIERWTEAEQTYFSKEVRRWVNEGGFLH